MMPNNTPKISVIVKTIVLLLAVCYLLAPMQKTLSGLAHDVSHAIAEVKEQQHTHNNLMATAMGRRVMGHHHHSETHQHSVLAFIDTLFKTSQSSHDNKLNLELNIDKHVVNKDLICFSRLELSQTHQYFYKYDLKNHHTDINTPPPELHS